MHLKGVWADYEEPGVKLERAMEEERWKGTIVPSLPALDPSK
jgi:hypothetical protein